jgi:Coenzyme PQQ synthesis protein D (PqqD)
MPEQLLQWDEIRAQRVSVPAHVVHRSFAAETVLLNIQSGHYHGLDAVGGRFFEVLRDAPDVETAVTTLAGEYEQPAERVREDMVEFCSELSDRGLIELAG